MDEEGRFFGGGITANTANALDFIDERDEENAGVCTFIPMWWAITSTSDTAIETREI